MFKLFGGKADAKHDPQIQFSNLLQRRLKHWKSHNKIKDKALKDEIERLRHFNNKANAYAFVRSKGIHCPTFSEYPNVRAAFAANADNPRFVLKPAAGHSSRGVFLLTRNSDGSLDCSMTKKHYANDAAIVEFYDTQQKLSSQFAMSEQVIVEEYVEDLQGYPVPLDYKVYAFLTGTTMIMQKHGPLHMPSSNWIFNFYDAKGKALEHIRDEPGARTRSIDPPANFNELVGTADMLVKAMNVSFIRLDFFLTTKGIYFGECTPLPNLGKKAFYDEYEIILGNHWANSLKKLGVDYAQA